MAAAIHSIRTRGTPEAWGPPIWYALHVLAEKTPEPLTDRLTDLWNKMLTSLQSSLPCPDCQQHFTQWYSTHPLGSSPIRLLMLELHNDVNRRRGVPVWTESQLAIYATRSLSEINTPHLAFLAELIAAL